jgi:hypothetical protein
MLEDDADVDDDVAKLLDGTGGDPDKIRSKVRQPARPAGQPARRGGAPPCRHTRHSRRCL